jgi:hypothetical protein
LFPRRFISICFRKSARTLTFHSMRLHFCREWQFHLSGFKMSSGEVGCLSQQCPQNHRSCGNYQIEKNHFIIVHATLASRFPFLPAHLCVHDFIAFLKPVCFGLPTVLLDQFLCFRGNMDMV